MNSELTVAESFDSLGHFISHGISKFLTANPAIKRFAILDDWENAGWRDLFRHLLLIPAHFGLRSADLPFIKAIMERTVG